MSYFKKLVYLFLLIIGSFVSKSYAANSTTDLPSIGVVASSTLSIAQEKEYGDVYIRMVRGAQPVVADPLLEDYINTIGHNLVGKAPDVKTKFTFFLVQNNQMNAFAFFGGHIGANTGLFLYAKNEDEFASVLAHEISHITQRHLARSMEAAAARSPLTIAGIVGSVILAMASPEAGIAALQATTAAGIQSEINYTRENEQEADRIGIATLSKAGYSAMAMSSFLTYIADEYRYASTPPEFLLSHPLPASRITDSRSRAQNYPSRVPKDTLRFELAKARILAQYSGPNESQAEDYFNRMLQKGSRTQKEAAHYGKALIATNSRQFNLAHKELDPLLNASANNLFYLDAATDLAIGEGQFNAIIARLQSALKRLPNNKVLQLNLWNAQIKSGQYKSVVEPLRRYTHSNPNDENGWQLLYESYEREGMRHQAMAARGEIMALKAGFGQAIKYYTQASNLAPIRGLDKPTYDARIRQLKAEKARFDRIIKS